MTALEVIQRSTAFLQEKGVESPRLQIELILARALQVPRLKLYLDFERVLTDSQLDSVREMVRRRAMREPLQHILGTVSFCGVELRCTAAALIPRPETELLAERAWQFLAQRTQPNAIDLGTGTGCIAIAIATHVPQATLHAIDLSPDALALARENAERHHVLERIQFSQGDGFEPVSPGERFDAIVSNPPYIPSNEIATLQPEVRDFDPRLALDGGADGLHVYRRLAREAGLFLKPSGKIMLEFGDGQAEPLAKLFSDEKWIVDEILADYSARPRFLFAQRPKD